MLRSASARLWALIAANLIAAAAVGVLTLVVIMGGVILSPRDAGMTEAIGGGLLLGSLGAVYAFAISLPFYLVGLIVLGIPTWWMLHQTGSIRPGPFVTIAALESALAGILVFRIFAPGSEIVAPLLAIPGGLAGWAIWRYGYSPLRPQPALPS